MVTYSAGLPTCMEGMMYPVPFVPTPDNVIEIAKHAEALGFHSVWGNDHMTTQRYVRAEYPDPPNYWEPLITYAYLAAETTTLKFGTGILVLPMRRDIVVVAKQIATLDQFSKGRFILGTGVGAYREEFEALLPGWQAHRGELLEDAVKALRMLFAERRASYESKYFRFEDVEMYPKPLQDPLPVYFGGNNIEATRRAAAYGQGWLPAGMPVDQMRERVRILRQFAADHGRDGSTIDVAPQLITYIGRTHEQAVERFRRSQIYQHLVSLKASTLKEQAGIAFEEANLVGTPDEVVEKIQQFAEAGVTHLCGTYFTADSVDELKEQMQIFAEDVMAKVNAA
ncbi:TIGR03619 family F420-dependent LLM class oxidoreductase [Anaerolineae bacterium CFX9]|nr:TIGR03619 family F420-dependent LLM class oxidoreductase [Anaerolineae bacterium CFX9]